MKSSKGFSIIELLAILIIIGVVALIAMPPILSILKDNQKSTFKDSAYGLLKSSEVYYTEQSMYKGGVIEDTTFTFPNSIDGLNFKGEVPNSGILKLDSEGRVAMALHDGVYCAIKEYPDGEIEVTKKSREKCQLSSLTFAYSRVPSKQYSVGSKLKYAKKNWIVMKDNEDSILVILEDVLTSSEIINALGQDLSSNDIFIYTNDKRWVRHCMSSPNHYQVEESHYCYYDNDLMENNQSYNWDRSIVKTIVDNWLDQTLIIANLDKENELQEMNFSDGLGEKTGYIRIPTKQDIEEDLEGLFKKANIEYWTLTWNKNTEHYSYVWGVVTDEKLFEDKSHFLAGVRPIIEIKKK